MTTISLEDICTIVSLTLGIQSVHGDDHIIEQLGAQSLDVARIATAVDRKYGIFLDESDLGHIATVNDLHQKVQELAEQTDNE